MTRPSEEQIQREEAGRRAYYEKRELLEMTCSVYAVLDDMGNIICTFEDRGHADHFSRRRLLLPAFMSRPCTGMYDRGLPSSRRNEQ